MSYGEALSHPHLNDEPPIKSFYEDETEDDTIQDFTSIITSFCARIYGGRRSKRKTDKSQVPSLVN